MGSLVPIVFVLLSIITLSHGLLDVASGFYRMTKFATVQITDQTNEFYLETISLNSNKSGLYSLYSCFITCIRNSACKIVVHDKDQNSCRLYKKTKLLPVSHITTDTNVVYDKLLKNLWEYNTCNQTSEYRYYSEYDLCLYFNTTNSVNFTDAYNFCVNLGGSLVTLETYQKFQLVANITVSYNTRVYVGSNTTIPKVFYWPDGSRINSSYWNTGEPNNNNGNATYVTEGCAVMDTMGLMNDSGCSNLKNFICEL